MSFNLKMKAEHDYVEVHISYLSLSIKGHNPKSNLNSWTHNKGFFLPTINRRYNFRG